MNGFDALANARNVTAVLSDQSDYGEHATRLPDESVKALKASGMLSLWRPAGLGGHECDPVTAAMATEEIAMADSAAGWMMHGVSAMWFDLRLASPELIEEVVASADVPVFAESYNKPQRAVAADGGFLINGATPFASNCQVADWIGHLAVSDESTLVVYHPRDVLTIDDDWNSLGMRGTSSNTVVSKDVFVPAHRVVDFGDPSPNADFEGALYRLPLGIVPVAVAAVALGALRNALDELSNVAENKTPFAASATLKHRTLAQLHFGEALSTYRAARGYFHDTLGAAFQQAEAGEPFDLRAKADLFLAYTHVMQNCAAAVRKIGKAAGTSAIYKGSPIERAIRDTEVISHHGFGAEGRFASAAQAYWGLDVDFPLMTFD